MRKCQGGGLTGEYKVLDVKKLGQNEGLDSTVDLGIKPGCVECRLIGNQDLVTL